MMASSSDIECLFHVIFFESNCVNACVVVEICSSRNLKSIQKFNEVSNISTLLLQRFLDCFVTAELVIQELCHKSALSFLQLQCLLLNCKCFLIVAYDLFQFCGFFALCIEEFHADFVELIDLIDFEKPLMQYDILIFERTLLSAKFFVRD